MAVHHKRNINRNSGTSFVPDEDDRNRGQCATRRDMPGAELNIYKGNQFSGTVADFHLISLNLS
ncbi:MAG: hypothetical protein K2H77_02040, partial [Alistipes sp.]|nr:hypothetical protein [Alistipes sp.]